MRPYPEHEIKLDGYYVLIAETSKDRRSTRGSLVVKCVFNLQNIIFKAEKKYGVIGRHPLEVQADDLMPWRPSQSLKVPSYPNPIDSYNFLSVEDNQMMVVFLMYNMDKSIFDKSVWPQTRSGRRMLLSENLLTYVIENTIDSAIIGGLGAPEECQDVKKIFCEIFSLSTLFCCPPSSIKPDCNDASAIVTGSMSYRLSINKCGVFNLPFQFNSYKHGRETPNDVNCFMFLYISLKEITFKLSSFE